MAEEKWLRQDPSELYRDWLFFLGAGPRLAWVMLKAYVRQAAVSQKRPNIAVALDLRSTAHSWNIPLHELEALIAAAVQAKALRIESGTWIVTDERGFQSVRTDERKRAETEPIDDIEEICPTNGDKSTQTEPNDDNFADACQRQMTDTGNTEPKGSGESPPTPYELARQVLQTVATALKWPEPKPADIRRYLKPDSDIQILIADYGPQKAAEMFLWAYRNWTQKPTWKAVCGQRHQIYEQMTADCGDRGGGGTTTERPWEWGDVPGTNDGSGRPIKGKFHKGTDRPYEEDL